MDTSLGAMKLLSIAALGIFLGAMLAEGCVLVPHWRSLPPDDFFAWYAANDRRLLGFFGPLTAVAVLIVVAAAVVSVWTRDPGRWAALVAAALMIVAVLMFPAYFQRANARFAVAAIAAADLPAELARWATWHWVRTALGAGALGAAMLAFRRGG